MLSAPILHREVCIHCEHPFSAVSEAALVAAHHEHVRFIGRTRDKEADDHFELPRMEQLLNA